MTQPDSDESVIQVDKLRRPEDGEDWAPAVQRAIDEAMGRGGARIELLGDDDV